MSKLKSIILSLFVALSMLLIFQSSAFADNDAFDVAEELEEPTDIPDDLEEPLEQRLRGFALKQPVSVYAGPSRDSNVLKNYNYNHSLVYYPYSENWYVATVYINGIAYRGYIHKDDVGNHDQSPIVRGIALKDTKVYSSADHRSTVLKTYKNGSILKYRSFNQDWHIATVYVNNVRHTGYISAKDVETTDTHQRSLQGIANKKTTNVYTQAAANSKVIKSYRAGQILKYRSFSKQWFEATVYVNGEARTGYISAKDVEPINEEKQILNGIGIKKPTHVYALASKDAKVLKSYKAGHILKYRPFSKNWYKATVYVNGKPQTGYISAKDVEPINEEKQTLNGVGIKKPTRVYALASKDASVLKNYKYGHILKFRTFSDNWYEATVYINGKRQTGYIFKYDVNTNLNSVLKGYAAANSTPVYSGTSRKSKILKRYKKGHLLQYRPYINNWFRATVYINGKAQTGYIHTDDVSPQAPKLKAYALANPTYVYSKTSRNSTKLKSYKQGHLLQFRPYNSYWYEATVYINGKARTGYIHVNDVGDLPMPGYNIPILMYHQIGDNPSPERYGLFVSAENFRNQMLFLKNAGYTPIHFDEIPNVHNIHKPIIITFDDGYENNMIAYEILKELNDDSFQSKATFFIIGSKIDAEGFLSEEQIKEISESGIISIQSHTMTHPHFNDSVIAHRINYTVQLGDIKKRLEEITGKKVTTLAYPYGAYNENVIEEVKKYYDYAVTTRSGIANTNDSPYELKRIRVSYDTTLEQFKKLIGAK